MFQNFKNSKDGKRSEKKKIGDRSREGGKRSCDSQLFRGAITASFSGAINAAVNTRLENVFKVRGGSKGGMYTY